MPDLGIRKVPFQTDGIPQAQHRGAIPMSWVPWRVAAKTENGSLELGPRSSCWALGRGSS